MSLVTVRSILLTRTDHINEKASFLGRLFRYTRNVSSKIELLCLPLTSLEGGRHNERPQGQERNDDREPSVFAAAVKGEPKSKEYKKHSEECYRESDTVSG